MSAGTAKNTIGFMAKASAKSNRVSEFTARSDPHPGQYSPVRVSEGQVGHRPGVWGSMIATASVATPQPTATSTGHSQAGTRPCTLSTVPTSLALTVANIGVLT